MDAHLQQKIKEAVSKAEDAFWTTVAAEFPEVKTGDLDPYLSLALTEKMTAAVNSWVQENSPENELNIVTVGLSSLTPTNN